MTTFLTAKEVTASYGELALVELPAINCFASLGWETANLYNETFGPDGTEGRKSAAEVIFVPRLRKALERINPGYPAAAYEQAIEQLTEDRSKQIPVNANQAFYKLLRDRVKVEITDDEDNPQTVELSVIDWNTPENNDFFLTQQMWISGEMYKRRCDLLGFVNGIPLVFIELKGPHVPLKSAYDDNLKDYKGQSIPQLFHPNAFILLSNGSQTRVGTLTSPWEHFFEWRRIDDETEAGSTSLETAIRGLCDKRRLLDIVENFTLFELARGGLIKKVAKNHQYLGVNKAIAQMIKLRESGDVEAAKKLGVFWHTQGSGKSLSMVFFTQKILRTLPGKWTFVIVTDRSELDDQIYKTFTATGAISGAEVQANSGEHLKLLLSQDQRYVFSLIQKFHTDKGEAYPQISDRSDIIVITDEAHRSQYDIFALNMRNALPNAAFLGFTGTPLIAGEEERTREVFGDYVSVYDFARSIEDGATVPLYYENRTPELQITNENLNKDIEKLLEEAELDEAQEKKLEREFAREYHLITRDERLETVAADLVKHFLGRGYRGKAMMVCIDKATAVRMYDKVQAHWKKQLADLQAQLKTATGDAKEVLTEKIKVMQTTDMAVVVSQSQNEIDDLKAKGLDIVPHRQRMISEDLDEKFKDPDGPLRLVFVCAMWITGFDVPTCSTLYLDKPMRNHTLMQTIARANRVAPGKSAGLIVDYVGIFRNLQDALRIYAKPNQPGQLPINDKAALVEQLEELLKQAESFCTGLDIDLKGVVNTPPEKRLEALQKAMDVVLEAGEDKVKAYLLLAGQVARTFKAILPDAEANAYAPMSVLVAYLGAMIKALRPAPDISWVMSDLDALLDDSIATEGYRIGERPAAESLIDLSQIDFAALQKKFEEGKKATETEKLKGQIEKKLDKMVRENKGRIDFLEKFQRLIESYNASSHNLEAFFKELMDFAQNLTEEEQRAHRESLSEEELAIFDLLTQPEPELSDKEKDEVKKVAKELLAKLKAEKLVLDWRLKTQTKADVERTIRDFYLKLPKSYSSDLKKNKRVKTYAHIYENYFGAGQSVYQGMSTGAN
ncbi:type I restriction endonuclease subunit R [Neopusillimonas aromaticivorans]|uniref:type I restriction endonuclease subunit R n=1 Tax=Neopusillimonas aromaticivorans TaxID=2979868 RepID=UPI002598B858|nr:type I restriction endonuclease subunit R [Neopusillimonas aromaticivorans]WJJ93974.1 type I restriction endonuclease subunit R [Neopusillimonas aromaticivorans]